MLIILLSLPLISVAKTMPDGFNYTIENEKAIITRYTGVEKNINIPSEINGYTVVRIGNYAFCENNILERVVIPEGVLSIGEGAFFSCSNLIEVRLPDSLRSIELMAFENCIKLMQISIPDSVIHIGWEAFAYCKSLSELKLPKHLETIEQSVFLNCENLNEIQLPSELTVIESNAFSGCANLKNILLPNKVSTIENNAFSNCINLKNIEIPNSVTTIGASAFSGTAIETLTIPSSVSNIGESVAAFSKLTSFIVDLNNKNYCADENGVLFNIDKTVLLEYPCENRKQTYSIPSTVRTISNNAFCGAFIEKLIIPSSVSTIIGKLTSFSLIEMLEVDVLNENYSDNNGVLFNKDGSELIEYPVAKKDVSYVIPVGVEKICDSSFSENYYITKIFMPDTVTYIEKNAFSSCVSLENIKLSGNLEVISDSAFSYNYSMKDLTIPSSVCFIGNFCFNDLYSLEKIKIYSLDVELDYGCSIGYHLPDNRFELAVLYKELYFAIGARDFEKMAEIEQRIQDVSSSSDYSTAYSYPVICYADSTAQKYAQENNIELIYFCDNHTETIIPEMHSTCKDFGLTQGVKCANCDMELVPQELILAKGHSLSNWITDIQFDFATRNCKNCDYTETAPIKNYGDGDVEIEYPDQPEADFDIEEIGKEDGRYVLVEEALKNHHHGHWEIVKVFDITLKNKDGVHIQPDGTVKIKLPHDWKHNDYKVYRVNDDGTITDMNAYRQGSHIVFETDHFSLYVIVDESAPVNEDTTENETPSGKKDVFGFLIKLINALTEFFMKILTFLGF